MVGTTPEMARLSYSNRLFSKSRRFHVGLTKVKCLVQNLHRRGQSRQCVGIKVRANSWVSKMRKGCNHFKPDAESVYLGCCMGQAGRQMLWNSDKWHQLFWLPYRSLRDEGMYLGVITGDVLVNVPVHYHRNVVERSFHKLDTDDQPSNSYKRKVFFSAVSPSLLTSCKPNCDRESSNCADCACPCAPVGRRQPRPADPFVCAQAKGRAEHNCAESVVPGLKPSSDLGEHRSSAKYLRDRTTARLRGYSAALPSTRAVIRPSIGEARPPRERRRYLNSIME